MLGTVIQIIGVVITAIGTFIRVVPDLDRRIRRTFYENYPMTRELFSRRADVKQADQGANFTIKNKMILREFVDYVDSNSMKKPPDQLPQSITAGAARIVAEFADESEEVFFHGGLSNPKLIEIITLAIEKRCRNFGLLIAVIGAVLVIIGTILPS